MDLNGESRLKNPQVNSALRHLYCKEAIRRLKTEEKISRNEAALFLQNAEVMLTKVQNAQKPIPIIESLSLVDHQETEFCTLSNHFPESVANQC